MISLISASFLFFHACHQDVSFTPLKTPEPPGEDTSAPPEEIVEVILEEPAECHDRIYGAGLVGMREDCRNEPVQSRFDPIIEWRLDSFYEYPLATQSMSPPFVGHMTDDNGDGIIGSLGDIPDIAALFFESPGSDWCGFEVTSGVLRLIQGDGSVVHWSVRDFLWEGETWQINPGVSVALGDIDADGEPDILAGVYQGRGDNNANLVLLDATGQVKWMSSEPALTIVSQDNYGSAMGHPGVWDLDQDGLPEVIFGNKVYSGQDGTRLLPNFSMTATDPVVSDIDKNGDLEIVTPHAIYEHDGTTRCMMFTGGQAFVSVADITGNGQGDVIVSGIGGTVQAFTNQCHLLWRHNLPDGDRGGAATVADYDGDGLPEVGVASKDYYFVFDDDGSELWRQNVSDRTSGRTASTVYDFDGDGYSEVVYAGEYNLWVFSGPDGAVRMVEPSQYSCTYFEYPLTVDVDGDGSVEIVVLDAYGLRVVAERTDSWVPARQVWNQYAYSITNINDDLSIPTYNEPNWPEFNSFRSGDLRVNNGQGALLVDVVPVLVDICDVECDQGRVQVVLQGANNGLADSLAGLSIAIYAEQEDGSREFLKSITLESRLRAGYTTEGLAVEFDLSEIPTGTLIIVADDDGTGTGQLEECDETNNELVLEHLCIAE